jgi:hypothetical protein
MHDFLAKLGIGEVNSGAITGGSNGRLKTVGRELVSISPIDGKPIAKVIQVSAADYEIVIRKAQATFRKWRMIPAPVRGQIVWESAVRRRRAGDVKPDLMPGNSTCAGRPAQSTGVMTCRWPRASGSMLLEGRLFCHP